MSKGKGYLLPSGDAYTDDLACALVWFPNKPEYRQALRGSLHYLGTWAAWERDELKRGQDAARAWKEANALSEECIEMSTCLDDLINAINAMSFNLSVNCNCEYATVNPPTPPEPTGIPGIGPVPTTWGEEDTTGYTWDEYTQLVCGAADAYVDFLIAKNEELINYINLGLLGIGIVSALIALMSGFGLAVVISLGTAAEIFAGLILNPSGAIFGGVASQLALGKEQIRNAIACEGGLRSVMESILDPLAWSLFYQFVDWEAATAILRSGEYQGEYLETPVPLGACDCFADYYTFTWNFSTEPPADQWECVNNASWDATTESIRAQVVDFFSARCGIGRDALANHFGFPDGTPVEFLYGQVTFTTESDYVGPSNVRLSVRYVDSGEDGISHTMTSPLETVTLDFFPDEPLEFSSDGDVRVIFSNIVGGPAQHIQADDITITVRIIGAPP